MPALEQRIEARAKHAREMRDIWERFRGHGTGSLTTPELKRLQKHLVDAKPLLDFHPDAGAIRKVADTDLTAIEGYLDARRRNA